MKQGKHPQLRVVKACARCPFSSGDSAQWCAAKQGGIRFIPARVDVDTQRPKWCPLPIVVDFPRDAKAGA